ncbi:hypothetical protein KIK06_17945 [Nocardiopsis sp. EMB25]|uniref:hypothetical protein n=1 Tax=Nocardiopsis TaxID=2013 RepID=UPI00034B7A14|nr:MULTISPECIES: hypothetical protein [Nocardiopsis]MCY9785773.1 hypothetical protein [Nocardiopsis sp. EMB25]
MPHESPMTPESGPSHWVDMRWRLAWEWLAWTGGCVGVTILMAVLAVDAVVTGLPGSNAFPFVLLVILVPLCWALLHMAPRYSTRQGVAVDGAGITLVQESKWWFRGRTTHFAWSRVTRISREVIRSRYGTSYLVDIELTGALAQERYPTWVLLDWRKIRIGLDRAQYENLSQILRTARPDLYAGE